MAGVVICGLTASAAAGYPRCVYLEQLCLNRDVVVGRITAVGIPKFLPSKPEMPSWAGYTPEWRKVCKLGVTDVLQEGPNLGEAGREAPRIGQEIVVNIPCKESGE